MLKMSGEPEAVSVVPPADCWSVFGASVCGASHLRRNQENQDAFTWRQAEPGQPDWAIVCLADGHGSSRSLRSARGSGLAVEIALKCLLNLVEGDSPRIAGPDLPVAVRERLPREIVENWLDAVAADILAQPFQQDEMLHFEQLQDRLIRREIILNPLNAYGSTLLAVLVTESYMAGLQLGDGDIILIGPDGIPRRPLPPDERLIADETTSLCLRRAWRDFRVFFERFTESAPDLIMLATDGCRNSFKDEESFLQLTRDLHSLVLAGEYDVIEAELPVWLNDYSVLGSGDDITLGLIAGRPRHQDCREGRLSAGPDMPAAVNLPGPDLRCWK